MGDREELYTEKNAEVIIGHITTPIRAKVLQQTLSILISHNVLVVPCTKVEEDSEAWYTLLFFPHNATQTREGEGYRITLFDDFSFIYVPPTFESSRIGRYKTHPNIEVNENSI